MLRRALIFVFFCTATLFAQSYPIVELKSIGSKRFKAEDIIRVTGLEKGKVTSLDTVRNAAQLLVNTGVFLEVRYSHYAATDGITVTFDVKDKPADQYLKCDFSNLVWFTEPELTAALRAELPLFDGTLPAGGGSSDQAASVIEHLLEKKNVHTHVSALEASPAPGKPIDSVSFQLEDAKVTIAGFRFTGITPALENELQKSAAFGVGRSYDHTWVDNIAKDRLVNIYRSRGYLRANFDLSTVSDVVVTGNATTVVPVLNVHEGLAYTFTGAKLIGNQKKSSEVLLALVKSPLEKPLDGLQFEKEIQKIKLVYDDDGYFKAKVEPKPQFDDAKRTVAYEVQISEGDRYTMGKLEVEGVSDRALATLREAWKMRDGEPYRKAYTLQFVLNFKFSAPVRFRFEETPEEETHTVDVTIIVSPQKPDK